MGHRDAHVVFCCLAFRFLANIPGRQLIAVYTATGQFAKYQWLYNTYSLLSGVTTAVALVVGARPVSLAVVIAGTSLSTILFSLWLLNRPGSRLYRKAPRFKLAHSSEFGVAHGAVWAFDDCERSHRARACHRPEPYAGGPAVALFTTTRTVANVVRGTLMLLRAPLRPEFGAARCSPARMLSAGSFDSRSASTRPSPSAWRRCFGQGGLAHPVLVARSHPSRPDAVASSSIAFSYRRLSADIGHRRIGDEPDS